VAVLGVSSWDTGEDLDDMQCLILAFCRFRAGEARTVPTGSMRLFGED